jgi:hypothetical protein
MLRELIPSISLTKWTCAPGSRTLWAYQPERILRHPEAMTAPSPEHIQEQPAPHAHPYRTRMFEMEETEVSDCSEGHSLFQELFFFCTVKNVGDVPGPGCIYVETVVDRDSGIAFAKVYSSKNAMNAVDILASRVAPFFEHRGVAIKEIHTRQSSEYCGLPPVHPFETYLATAHIQHLPMQQPGQPCNYLCEQFYRFLLKEFFMPALRRKFQFSLDDLQKGLDIFVEAYNAMQMKRGNQRKNAPPPSVNFPVDL